MNERLTSETRAKASKVLVTLLAILLAFMTCNSVSVGMAFAENQESSQSASNTQDRGEAAVSGKPSVEASDSKTDSGKDEAVSTVSENEKATGGSAEIGTGGIVSPGNADNQPAGEGQKAATATAASNSSGEDQGEKARSNNVSSSSGSSGSASQAMESQNTISGKSGPSKVASKNARKNASRNVSKNAAGKKLTAAAPENVTYNGQDQKEKPKVSDKETGAELAESDYSLSWSDDVKNAGEVTVTIDGTGEYAGSSTSVTYQINPATATVTTGSASKVYDGNALTEANASIVGLLESDTANVTATGSQTEVGESENTYSITWGNTDSGNYTVSESLGKLSVTWDSSSVVFTAPSASKTYDGTPLTADGTGEKKVEVAGLPEGYTAQATASGSQTNAGSCANIVSSYSISDAAGEDRTVYFPDVQKVDGKLTVSRAQATVTANSMQKTVGEPDPTLTAEVTGLFGSDTVSYTLSRDPGEVAGAYAIIPAGEAVQGNYDVAYVPGMLGVYPVAKHVLVVHYRYAISKATAAPDYSGRYAANAPYAVPLPNIRGYHAVDSNGKTIAGLRGTMPAQDLERTVFYVIDPPLPAPSAAPAPPSVPVLASVPAPLPAAAPALPAAKTASDYSAVHAKPKEGVEESVVSEAGVGEWVWIVGLTAALALLIIGVMFGRRVFAKNERDD